MSSPGVSLMCQKLSWTCGSWNYSLQPLRTMSMYGSEVKAKEMLNDGNTSMQKTLSFMAVHEQLQYMTSLHPIVGNEKYFCTGPMFTPRPIFSVNNNMPPTTKARQSCDYHLPNQKAYADKPNVLVIPPPPGFLVSPKANCHQCCTAAKSDPAKPPADEDEDLDIDSLIEEFRVKSKVHEEYESTFFLRKFFVDNLNTNFTKSLNGDDSESIYGYLLQGASSEKIADITYEFLRRFGYDAVFFKLQNTSMRFYNMLAMEICCNELLSSKVITACNHHAKTKKRMDYTKMFKKK